MGASITIAPSAASITCGLVPLLDIFSLGVGARVFIFRKRAGPAIGEIKDRHVQDEHRVVPARPSLEEHAHSGPEIVLALFGFHTHFVFPLILIKARPVTTVQWRDFGVPLSREQRRVARRPLDR